MTTVDAARTYLEGKSCTLWGDWDLTKPERLQQAAEWLATQVDEVNKIMAPKLSERHVLDGPWPGVVLCSPSDRQARPTFLGNPVPYNDLRRNLPA